MGPVRLIGIDVARALALFGMFAAHLVDVEHPVDWTEPSSWWSIVAGRSSVLFATLAGVSLALVTGRDRPVSGAELTVARKRIAVRGGVIAGLGLVLMALGTPVAVILTTYGLLFFAVLPTLRWRRRGLLIAAGVLALVASPFAIVMNLLLYDADSVSQQVFLSYPLVTFAAYLLLGLAIGRSDLTSRRFLRILLVAGASAAVVAYSAGEAVTPGGALYEAAGSIRLRDFVFASEPHSSTLVDMIGSAGVAVAVIGVCGLLTVGRRMGAQDPALSDPARSDPARSDPARSDPALSDPALPDPALLDPARRDRARLAPRAMRVLAAVGSKPLTIYSAQLVAIAILIGAGVLPGFGDPALAVVRSLPQQTIVWACFVVGACALALAIGSRRGPLEELVGGMARRMVPSASSGGTESRGPASRGPASR